MELEFLFLIIYATKRKHDHLTRIQACDSTEQQNISYPWERKPFLGFLLGHFAFHRKWMTRGTAPKFCILGDFSLSTVLQVTRSEASTTTAHICLASAYQAKPLLNLTPGFPALISWSWETPHVTIGVSTESSAGATAMMGKCRLHAPVTPGSAVLRHPRQIVAGPLVHMTWWVWEYQTHDGQLWQRGLSGPPGQAP